MPIPFLYTFLSIRQEGFFPVEKHGLIVVLIELFQDTFLGGPGNLNKDRAMEDKIAFHPPNSTCKSNINDLNSRLHSS